MHRQFVALLLAFSIASVQAQLPFPRIPQIRLPGGKPLPGVLGDLPNRAVTQASAKALGALFNDHLPIYLDARTAFSRVPVPPDFQPATLRPNTNSLYRPLLPGDYKVPLVALCTKDSIHRPGRGVGYELAPLKGKHASAIATMLARGTANHLSHDALQSISWSIQASISYSQMPPEHRQIVDRLIPEFRSQLDGDFMQSLDHRYQQFAAQAPQLPPFEKLLDHMGPAGTAYRSVRRSRALIRESALDYERLQQRLYDGPPGREVITPSVPEPSPWTLLRPGVLAQVEIGDGWQGRNWLHLRITPEAVSQTAALGAIGVSRYTPATTLAGTAVRSGVTLAELFGILARGAAVTAAGEVLIPVVTAGLIIYSIAQATQALIVFVEMQGGDGEPPEEGSSRSSKIEIDEEAFGHVRDRHTPGGIDSAGKGVFSGGEDLESLIRQAENVPGEVQRNGNVQRIVNAGREIGIDKDSRLPTRMYTVITDANNRLVTMFPGLPSIISLP
jgi:hypothetical protein